MCVQLFKIFSGSIYRCDTLGRSFEDWKMSLNVPFTCVLVGRPVRWGDNTHIYTDLMDQRFSEFRFCFLLLSHLDNLSCCSTYLPTTTTFYLLSTSYLTQHSS